MSSKYSGPEGPGRLRTPVSALAQWFFTRTLEKPGRSVLRRLRYSFARSGWRALLNCCDPLVRYQLEGMELWIPLSHRLPHSRRACPQCVSNLGRIAAQVSAHRPDFTLVDVGANVGDSVAILRSRAHFPILCVEGEPRFFSILQLNMAGQEDIELENTLVGRATETLPGRVESKRGTARVIGDPGGRQTLHFKTLADILHDHPRFSRPGMIKLDTDGMDSLIVRSALPLLAELKPVLFFEYDPYFMGLQGEEGLPLFEDLRRAGYGSALVYENNGDYLLALDLADRALLEDLDAFYRGRSGERYCDICVFPEHDSELCGKVRSSELEFFRQLRGSQGGDNRALVRRQ
ncbi:MAG: FkbM family methyltransferase [Terriglobales bacterium]